MTQEMHSQVLTFASGQTSTVLRLGNAHSILAIRIPATGSWTNGTLTLQSAFGTAALGDQTADADIADWADVYDDANGAVSITATGGANPKMLHLSTNILLAGNFFRLVSSASENTNVVVYYRSIFG